MTILHVSFSKNSALVHCVRNAVQMLQCKIRNILSPKLWPPCYSPELNRKIIAALM